MCCGTLNWRGTNELGRRLPCCVVPFAAKQWFTDPLIYSCLSYLRVYCFRRVFCDSPCEFDTVTRRQASLFFLIDKVLWGQQFTVVYWEVKVWRMCVFCCCLQVELRQNKMAYSTFEVEAGARIRPNMHLSDDRRHILVMTPNKVSVSRSVETSAKTSYPSTFFIHLLLGFSTPQD